MGWSMFHASLIVMLEAEGAIFIACAIATLISWFLWGRIDPDNYWTPICKTLTASP